MLASHKNNAIKICLAILALLVFSIGFADTQSGSTAFATVAGNEALAIYEEGKQRYDQGDYKGARSKFLEAIKREPNNARWHYNLGLTLRQLDNAHAARQSLLKARELDPEYKRAEIDQKLASMGFGAAPESTVTDAASVPLAAPEPEDEEAADILWMVGGIFGLVLSFIGGVFWLIRRAGRNAKSVQVALMQSAKSPVKESPPDVKAMHALHARLVTVSKQLVSIEHAMRLSENADLRNLLDHATQTETALYSHLDAALDGNGHAFRKANRSIADLESSTQRAMALSKRLHGDQAFAGTGEKIGCYFCARPLANANFRKGLVIKRGDTRTEIVSCPPCAAVAARGEAPAMLTGEEGKMHWSELADFDPYAARHANNAQVQRVPAWKFAPQRSLAELALLAGGAALAGGALASALHTDSSVNLEPLLDLDAAKEAGLAQAAASATAKRAAEQRSDSNSSFSDHS